MPHNSSGAVSPARPEQILAGARLAKHYTAGYSCPYCTPKIAISAIVAVIHHPGCPRGHRQPPTDEGLLPDVSYL